VRAGTRAAAAALAAAAGAALLAAPALAQGCAMCSRNLEQNGGEGLLRGFLGSALLLVSLPVALVGGFALLLRRARLAASVATGTEPAPSPPEGSPGETATAPPRDGAGG
jgi:hypothetical protein